VVDLAVGGHHLGRPKGGQNGIAGGAWQAGVEGCHRIAAIPHRAQGVDEPRSSWKVECDEFRHWR
jgi:hypothetical protein